MIEHLPNENDKPAHIHQKCRQKLRNLCDKLQVNISSILSSNLSSSLQTIDDIHTIDNLAHAHIAQCSAENIMLWCQFIQTFGLHESVGIILGKDYHYKRVKRFSEGFFHREISRNNLFTNESDSYNDFHELIRNSPYYSRLPPLPIECIELDGIPDTLPILIEEIYTNIDSKSATLMTSSMKYKNSSNNHENPLVQAVQNFSKNLLKGI